jgi:hypothetical protein
VPEHYQFHWEKDAQRTYYTLAPSAAMSRGVEWSVEKRRKKRMGEEMVRGVQRKRLCARRNKKFATHARS